MDPLPSHGLPKPHFSCQLRRALPRERSGNRCCRKKSPHFPTGSRRSPSHSHLPDTHPRAARDVFESKDFIIAFYAFSKLSFIIVSACLIMAPHLACRNSCPFLFLLFGHNFHASNNVFFSPLLLHYNGFFCLLHCWCTSSLAPSCLQPSYPISPLWSLNNLTDAG